MPARFRAMLAVYLASQSPRRRALLEGAGVDVRVVPASYDERTHEGETAQPYARRVAAGKLEAARAHGRPEAADRFWLAADTVVWLDDGRPIGKPADRAEAQQMLARLAGSPPHFVTTAWAVAWADDPIEVFAETTRVFMRPHLPGELEAYLDKGSWRDKAGGYGIQGEAASWVTRIEGSYTNVVGLPLAQVLQHLNERTLPGGR